MVVVLVQLRLAQSKAWRAGLQPESTVLLREHRRVAALPQAGSFLLRLILAYRRQPSVSVMGENDMNKNILIGLVLIAAAAGGYYQFSVKPAQEAAAAAAEAAAAEKASAFTKNAVANAKKIQIELKEHDKFGGRVLGDVILDGQKLSELLIKNGHARAYFGEKKQSWCE